MSEMWKKLDAFDSIQLCTPDIHCVPRGKVVAGEFKQSAIKNGLDFWRGFTMLGPKGDIALSVPYFNEPFPSHDLRPCLETLTPWPWVSTEDRRVGNVIGDIYMPDGSPDMNCPRQLLKAQLDVLRKNHGLVVKTAFEYEFYVYKENTLEPLGKTQIQFADLRVWGEHQTMFSELREMLDSMGIKVNCLMSEFGPGQWELTTIPYEGIHGADVGFYVKTAIKGFFKSKGYDSTFMTRPLPGGISSGMHMNHSLWKVKSSDGNEKENAFLGTDGDFSPTTKHWIAGILTHVRALSALLSPSLNCYRRLYNMCAPSVATWGKDDRTSTIRARMQGTNAFLENRLASSAASPYLVLAATVAAGLDGLDRRLKCPPPSDSSLGLEMPRSLAEALTALEEDQELTSRLSKDFVSHYVDTKRVLEVEVFEKAGLESIEEGFTFERDMYFAVY